MKQGFTIEKEIQALNYFIRFFPGIIKMVFCKAIRNSKHKTLF
jgi:hypothetical protein